MRISDGSSDVCSSDLKARLIAVVTEPAALGALKSPGEMDADIVVGEGQSIGVGLQFGGPYVGLFGCKQKYVRSEEHTSELQSLMRISYAVFCLKKKTNKIYPKQQTHYRYNEHLPAYI